MQKNLVRVLLFLLSASLVLYSQSAQAVTIQNCGQLPRVAVQELRNIKAGTVTGKVYNNAGGHGGTKLPPIGRGQEYREYDVDANNPNVANRGRYRLVALVTPNNGKNIYNPVYFTQNHYQTFCKV